MFRYKLPITVIVINNGGIYSGLDGETYKDIQNDEDLALKCDIVYIAH